MFKSKIIVLCLLAFQQTLICSDRQEHKVAPSEDFLHQKIAELGTENAKLKEERDNLRQSYEERRIAASMFYEKFYASHTCNEKLKCVSIIMGIITAITVCVAVAPATLELCQRRNKEMSELLATRELEYNNARKQFKSESYALGKVAGFNACIAGKHERIQRNQKRKPKQKDAKTSKRQKKRDKFKSHYR